MQKKTNDNDSLKKRFLIFVVVSLLLHLTLLVSVYEIPWFRSEAPAPPPPQEVVFVRAQDVLPALPQGLELADIAKPAVEEAPDRAHFAAAYNSKVEKETVARKIPKEAKPEVEVSEEPKASKAKTNRKAAQKNEPPREFAQQPDRKKGSAPKEISLSDLQVKTSDFKDLAEDFGSPEGKDKDREADRGPDLAALPRFKDFSGPGDHFVHDFMPNVQIGDKTYLNTQAMPNVQYFTRLKRIFRMRFNPANPLVSYFRYNRVVVGKVNVTMAVEVSASGELKKLFVMRSSGIPGYDEEALRTIRQSAPFSAPPRAILGKDGMLRMTWHFTTYL